MAEKEELTIKIPKDENEKAILARELKAKAKEKEKEKEKEDEDAKCAGCMSIFFCCLVLQ